EDAGSYAGGDGNGEDEGCEHATPRSKRRGAAKPERFRRIGVEASQNSRRSGREDTSQNANTKSTKTTKTRPTAIRRRR
ncbi:MAG TPA: hypothetical protein VM096_18640, partial [Vicinamibacterales bacterium]|nr:hypothetical protein [Vicinamibacterales bacterium]